MTRNLMMNIHKYIMLLIVLFLSIHTASADSKDKDSIFSAIVAKGQEQLRQLQWQNQRNEQAGHAEQNQYVLNIHTKDAASETNVGDTNFIQQRQLTQDVVTDRKGSQLLINGRVLDSLNKQLRLMNWREGNSIKTYLLLVDYVPMYFNREIPPNATLQNLLSGKLFDEEANKETVRKAQIEAGDFVKAITEPFLQEQGAVKTLFCGFLKFRTFVNRKSIHEIIVYYPHHNIDSDGRPLLNGC